MKVTNLDDYQCVFAGLAAIKRLRQKAEVQIYTEKFDSEGKLIRALEGSQSIIPIRERTQFSADLLNALPDLEIIAQTGNQAYGRETHSCD
jgi:D-3-phosphoglycerate dehydrogenase